MKKLIALALAFVLCFSLVVCGQSTPTASQERNTANQNIATNAPSNNTNNDDTDAAPITSNDQLSTVDVAFVVGLLSTVTNQLDDAKNHLESVLGSNSRGFLLERAMEYHVVAPKGFEAHGRLMQVKGDVACNQNLYDSFQIGIDLTTNEIFLSYTEEFQNWFNNEYTGEITSGRDTLMLCTDALPVYEDGTQFYFPNEQIHHFSQDVLDEINAGLGWSYTPHSHDVPTDEIDTTAEERITMVTDAVNAFLSQRGGDLMEKYANLTGSPSKSITVAHAMEFRLGSMDGYPVHALLINILGNFANDTSSNNRVHVFYDLQTGEIYDSFMLTDDFFDGFEGFCRSEADVPLFTLNLYYNVVESDAPYVVREGEESAILTDEDLAVVNNAFTN